MRVLAMLLGLALAMTLMPLCHGCHGSKDDDIRWHPRPAKVGCVSPVTSAVSG